MLVMMMMVEVIVDMRGRSGSCTCDGGTFAQGGLRYQYLVS